MRRCAISATAIESRQETNSLCFSYTNVRRLVDGFSQRKSDFDPKPVHVGFAAHQVSQEQVDHRLLRFSLSSSVPPIICIHTHPPIFEPLQSSVRKFIKYKKKNHSHQSQ
jgi:hypothetical protein